VVVHPHGARSAIAAFADLGHPVGGAPGAGLLHAGVGGAGDRLAGAGLIAGDLLGTAGAGAAHHQRFVGDAEAHLGGLRCRLGAAEALVLLGADVFVAGDQAAGAGFVTGDVLAAAHVGAGDAGAPQGVEAADLGGGAAGNLGLVVEKMMATMHIWLSMAQRILRRNHSFGQHMTAQPVRLQPWQLKKRHWLFKKK